MAGPDLMKEQVHGEPPAYLSMKSDLRGRPYEFRYLDRPGTGPTIVFLHGLGCGKEDCLPWAQRDPMISYRVLAPDFPGCSGSPYSHNAALRMTDLVGQVQFFAETLELRGAVIVGHSMGGLIGLLLCALCPSDYQGFVNVEGNLAPEDCMFSRRAASGDFDKFESELFSELRKELASASGPGFARYRATLDSGTSARAYYDYARDLVAYSDSGTLIEQFLALPMAKAFVFGSENAHLTYLPRLRASLGSVIEIAGANHFSFHDKPDAFAAAVAEFLGALPSLDRG